MTPEREPANPWGVSFTAEVTYKPTGETYGVGEQGSTIFDSLILEGNTTGVEANIDRCWAVFDFDLPLKLPLGPERWSIPFDDTVLQVRLLPKQRGDELWSSLDTTALPEFTRVAIKASPTFVPSRVRRVAEVVLENIDMLLLATDRPPMKRSLLERLSLRATFYERPLRAQHLLTATVPLTAEVRYEAPEPVPITDEVVNRLASLRDELVSFVGGPRPDTTFLYRVREIIHDFSFFGRQHPGSLRVLREEVLRDLLLVVFKHVFTAEGEVFHQRGKSDIKVSNPYNRYEFAIVELKVWRGEASIDELMRQAFTDHVTGQESLIVCQIVSHNRDFAAVVRKIRDLINAHSRVIAPMKRVAHEGTSEVLFETIVRVWDNEVPLLVSCVDLRETA